MGSRDFKRRETKKPKKDTKKLIQATVLPPTPVEVEVIKKGKKRKGFDEVNED